MGALDVVEHYFEVYNRRNPEAVAAMFADGGTFTDPVAGDGATGSAIADLNRSLFEAFPDLEIEILSSGLLSKTTVVVQWRMRGTNKGPLAGFPPTGRSLDLTGADFVVVEGDRVRSIDGYFDRATMMEQLGMQVIVQPHQLGSVRFGRGSHVTASNDKPGAFSMTSIEVRSDEEAGKLTALANRVKDEMEQTDGFIGLVTALIGHRAFTIAAWKDEAAAARIHENAAHNDAMAEFFGSDFCSAGFGSLWNCHHISTLWSRCGSCGELANYEEREGQCDCGATLYQPSYW